MGAVKRSDAAIGLASSHGSSKDALELGTPCSSDIGMSDRALVALGDLREEMPPCPIACCSGGMEGTTTCLKGVLLFADQTDPAAMQKIDQVQDIYADATRLAAAVQQARTTGRRCDPSNRSRTVKRQTLRAKSLLLEEGAMGADVPDMAARAAAKSAASKRRKVSISGSHAAAEQASAQDVIYTQFLEKTLPILRTDLGLCIDACCVVLRCSLNKLYHTDLKTGKSMVDRLGLKTYQSKTEFQKLPKVTELSQFNCCQSGPCLSAHTGTKTLEQGRHMIASCQTFKEQDAVIAKFLWVPALGCTAPLCPNAVHAWLGVHPTRTRRVQNAVKLAAHWGYIGAHGLVEWRKLNPPPNKVPAHVIQQIQEHFDIYTRVDPHSGDRRCTSTHQRTKSGLARGFLDAGDGMLAKS